MRRFLVLIAVILGELVFSSQLLAVGDELSALLAQADEAYNTGRYLEAVPVAERIVALSRENYGEADPRYAAALNGLATFLQFTGSLDQAEQLLRQSLAIDLSVLGPDHPDVATREANLALVLLDKDNAVEAAELLHRALASLDRLPATPERNGATLSNFAAALERLNRFPEAEHLYLAAISAFTQQPRENGSRLAIALGNLGILYKTLHRLDEGRPLLEQAVAILEGLSTPKAPHPRLATALNNLGTLLEDKGDYGRAEPLYRRALDIDRAMFGPDSPRLATRLSNLAGMYITLARYDEATQALREAMRIDRASYGDNHPRVAHLLLTGARLLSAKKEWEGAYTLISRSADIMIEADARRGLGQGRIEAGRDIPDVSLSQIVYATFLQVSGEWPWVDTSQFSKLGGPAFDIAQRQVTPAAAAAISRMASRYASGNPNLAEKVRRQQDLTEKWNLVEARIIAHLARPADRIDHEAMGADRRSQAQFEQELKSVGGEIQQGSQDYAAFSGARVLTIARVQELLAQDEALVYFADDGVHVHAFFVTTQNAAWMPLAFTSATIAEHVQALRCGLDGTSWLDDRADRCFGLLHVNYGGDDFQRGEELPFDLGRAHQLHQALFATLGSRIAGKRLIVVPTGALAMLPFQVLVTEPPDASVTAEERYRKAAWLVKQQPITVLPSVASLEALRTAVPKGRATKPFIGIGNPLLDGPQGAGMSAADRRRIEALAELARSKETCPRDAAPPSQRTTLDWLRPSRAATTGARSVRELFALPETAEELCAIAQALGVNQDNVLLGARATRSAVLALSQSGAFESFAVVHFATHGLVSGELEGLAEPALALTPEKNANDNGLLTASDIAELRLNADWVVLSSCNTAAGSADDKEAFSGLARAFFLAGTRALMVSHWPVYSDAAVALTTRAYKELQAEPSIGRAEALRRSMLALIDQGGVKARPAYWAPFVVVGEGG
jgi:CHAT domain-containing protein/Flp pilus assembly protein TadD